MACSLSSLGWDDRRAAEFAPLAPTSVAGRVVRVDRGAADVLTADNPLRLALEGDAGHLAVGDWVALAVDDRRWYVESVLERRSEIRRAPVSGSSSPQVLAVNVDVAFVVVPAVPEPRPGMTERLVALVWDSGATPVVVMTKADRVADPERVAEDLRASAPGADVEVVTAMVDDGFAPLAAHLGAGRTCCLLGRSGAGKSTLANALLGADRFATADIRSDGKGRHTTTFRELVVLPSGAVLIDTPGLRSVGLSITGDGLERAFEDLEEIAGRCRFADCGHDTEPGCAVTDAIRDGRLSERRLQSWRKLQREVAWMARRTDARLRAEEQRRWKAISLEMRRSGRPRP